MTQGHLLFGEAEGLMAVAYCLVGEGGGHPSTEPNVRFTRVCVIPCCASTSTGTLYARLP
jgi:hypothetical protein